MLLPLLLFAIVLLSIAACLNEGIIYILRNAINDKDDDDVSGREESQNIRNKPPLYTEPYTYYMGTNKYKTYKKQKRTRWQEEFDFN